MNAPPPSPPPPPPEFDSHFQIRYKDSGCLEVCTSATAGACPADSSLPAGANYVFVNAACGAVGSPPKLETTWRMVSRSGDSSTIYDAFRLVNDATGLCLTASTTATVTRVLDGECCPHWGPWFWRALPSSSLRWLAHDQPECVHELYYVLSYSWALGMMLQSCVRLPFSYP